MISCCHPFSESDTDPFLLLAGQEGWISSRWELEFLLRSFPEGCLVWREDDVGIGYVTAVKYGRSGWVGNLLVRPEGRRRGIGRALMERAISALLKSGVETIWLTASEDGAGLYRKLGFSPIDSINRWSGQGALSHRCQSAFPDVESLRAIDRVGWGDRREALLRETCGRGRLVSTSGGFICGQQWAAGNQVGPWNCLIPAQAQLLLEDLVIPGDQDTFLDVPAGNFAAASLLRDKGFSVQGSTQLMYLGHHPLYQPGTIYALASMGSMG